MAKKRSRTEFEQEQIQYLKEQLPLIQVLRELTPQQAQIILPYIDCRSHDAICYCVDNALRNYSKFDRENVLKMKETLTPKLLNYRYLSDKKLTSSDKVRQRRGAILEQSGEGLPLILSAVLPLLSSFLFPSKKE